MSDTYDSVSIEKWKFKEFYCLTMKIGFRIEFELNRKYNPITHLNHVKMDDKLNIRFEVKLEKRNNFTFPHFFCTF